LIDTIKIYANVSSKIYDIISNSSIVKTSYSKADGEVFYEIINDHLQGSYSSSLSVRVCCSSKYGLAATDYVIEIEGSYHKISRGYNSHNGFYDLEYIVSQFIDIVSYNYNVVLPAIENWYLQRCDISLCFDLESQEKVCSYINNLSCCKYPRRNLKFYQDESIYVSGAVTTIKIYNKLLEFKKHDLKKFANTDFNILDYLSAIKGYIRFECEIKKRKLKEIYECNNIKVLNVKYEDLKKVWSDEFMRFLRIVDNDFKIISDREEVFNRLNTVYKPVKARNLYNFYLMIKTDGIDTVKLRTSRPTFYRNISDLKECNIDFSQKYEIQNTNNIVLFNPFMAKEVV